MARRERFFSKWKEDHSRFKYSLVKSKGSVTTDNVYFFPTMCDLNRFYSFKRIMSLRVMRCLARKRLMLFRECLRRWKLSVSDYSEENIINTHFLELAIDLTSDSVAAFATNEIEYLKRFTEDVSRMHRSRRQQYARLIESGGGGGPADANNEHEDIASLPLKLPPIRPFPNENVADAPLDDVDRHTARNRSRSPPHDSSLPLISAAHRPFVDMDDIPSYFPAEGISDLPPLPEIVDPGTADGRLKISRSRRVDYCGYNVTMRGPTDNSFWVLPSRVACGSIPLGLGCTSEGHAPVLSISALMLAGVDFFISLLEEEEERRYEDQYFEKLLSECVTYGRSPPERLSVSESMKSAFMKAGYSANEIVVQSTLYIEKQKAKLDAIPDYGKSDPRLEKVLKEKMRYKARIAVANDRIAKAKAQLKKIPKKVDWLRMPASVLSAPDPSVMLIYSWEIERKLREGRNLYLYSKDGHGRCGMFGALLLGRLYGLHPYEVPYYSMLNVNLSA